MKQIRLIATILFIPIALWGQKKIEVVSPDKKMTLIIAVNKENLLYSVQHSGDILINESPISMKLQQDISFGINPQLKKVSVKSVNQKIKSEIYKKSEVLDHFNETILHFNNYRLICRAYNDGVAYRFISDLNNDFIVEDEQVTFNFPNGTKAFIPYVNERQTASGNIIEKQFFTSFENVYSHRDLTEWEKNKLAFLPILVESTKGRKICITEADLLNYPGMFLTNQEGDNSIEGVFATFPKYIEQGGHNMLQGLVKERFPYIAKCEKNTQFPWRVIIVAEEDKELLNSDMVYKLASPCQIENHSWVKPGKVAWDWWNAWNLYGVDFKSGINNETYKYYIDFASEHGIEYVILDEGWAVNKRADLMQIIPEIDLKEIIGYANGKNVDIILWAGYLAVAKDMEGVCKHYADMGVKGFKVDFMDRDDQPMVKFHTELAQIAAKHKLMLDFHGTYKPTGLHRTYPNVINFEGVFGLEQMKWSSSDVDQVTYDVTMPFIRMVAGPIDYTQGAMRNAARDNYQPVNSEAMSQGTRCRQLAQYVIFESPINMLCDSPSNYMNESECTDFIANIPTVWDETIAISGRVSEYVCIARRKGSEWYVGALTNWDARTMEIDLSFLKDGLWHAEVFKDGANADRAARDYKKEIVNVAASNTMKISMAPGGGYVMRIFKEIPN